VTSIPELASSIRPIAIADLRVEARSMHSDEALLVNLDGRAFVVITADAWADLVESAGGHDDVPLTITGSSSRSETHCVAARDYSILCGSFIVGHQRHRDDTGALSCMPHHGAHGRGLVAVHR